MHRARRPLSSPRNIVALAVILMGLADAAPAQFASNIRLTNPIGRTVLELRKGTQPANPRLLFTAAITAGPTGGTTSLLLHQMPIADLFNPAVPAAGWVTVRSSTSAYSLGGGCGRSNLIDFPFINGSRPEILRITGTAQQVITLGIAGNDQYDSIDCVTQGDGRVLYMLTNRTRQRLEFRREQGGLLQLVRDDFGTVLTPFAGGMRPSLVRTPRRVAPGPAMLRGATDRAQYAFFFAQFLFPETVRSAFGAASDDDSLTPLGTCNGPSFQAPAGFTIPKESAVSEGIAIGHSRNDNVLWGDYFFVAAGGCTQTQAPESFGSAGPFGFYTWGGVAASPVFDEYLLLVLPQAVIVQEGPLRTTLTTPFMSRGGPVGACPLIGTEIDAAQVLVGVGPSSLQVQHNILSANRVESHGRSGFEDPGDSVANCD